MGASPKIKPYTPFPAKAHEDRFDSVSAPLSRNHVKTQHFGNTSPRSPAVDPWSLKGIKSPRWVQFQPDSLKPPIMHGWIWAWKD